MYRVTCVPNRKDIMNVSEIVKAYLEENGYDGLCRGDCGCSKDDLFVCEFFCNCDSAYRWECDWCTYNRECDTKPGMWCYRPERQK